MISITPYLNFPGNCLEAFEFYKSVFGGDFPYVGRYKDMPSDAGHPLPEHLKDKIMHMSLPIGENSVLMGSDALAEFGQKVDFNGNIEIMISAGTRAEIDAIWAKLSESATITMPLEVAFWGDYFGGLTDKFGVRWMLNCPAEG